MAKWNIDKLCRPKKYMGQIMAECDCRSQLCEDRGHCMAATPSPEALVKAALKRAAEFCKPAVDEAQAEVCRLMRERGGGKAEDVWTGRLVAAQTLMAAFRSLASDSEAVAQIISAASQLNKERSDEEGRG